MIRKDFGLDSAILHKTEETSSKFSLDFMDQILNLPIKLWQKNLTI